MMLVRRLGFVGMGVVGLGFLFGWGCSSKTGGKGSTTSAAGSGGAASSVGSMTASNGGHGPIGSMSATTTMASTGSGPIMCMSMYTNIPKGDCDLLQQNCAPGSNCQPVGMGMDLKLQCLPNDMNGLKDKAAACSTNSECKPGLFCVSQHCTPVCCPDNNEPCGAGGTCDIKVNYTNTMDWAMMCSYEAICHLFQGDCAQGTQCHVVDFMACGAVCDPPSGSQAMEGGACTFRNDCGDSQQCNNQAPDGNGMQGSPGKCRYFCDTTMSNAMPGKGGCPQNETCKPIQSGCTNTGICLPM